MLTETPPGGGRGFVVTKVNTFKLVPVVAMVGTNVDTSGHTAGVVNKRTQWLLQGTAGYAVLISGHDTSPHAVHQVTSVWLLQDNYASLYLGHGVNLIS